GCTPVWLNEGTAMYFAGRPPRAEWTRMLRKRELVDIRRLEVSTIDQVGIEDVDLLYAQSLAMVLFTADPASEAPLARVFEDLDDSRAHTGGLWARRHPGIGPRELVDSVARRVFGV